MNRKSLNRLNKKNKSLREIKTFNFGVSVYGLYLQEVPSLLIHQRSVVFYRSMEQRLMHRPALRAEQLLFTQ